MDCCCNCGRKAVGSRGGVLVDIKSFVALTWSCTVMPPSSSRMEEDTVDISRGVRLLTSIDGDKLSSLDEFIAEMLKRFVFR